MRELWDALRPYRKSVAGLVTPGIVVLLAALLPASDGGWSITGPEWSAAGAACITTALGVFAVKNKPRRRTPRRRRRVGP